MLEKTTVLILLFAALGAAVFFGGVWAYCEFVWPGEIDRTMNNAPLGVSMGIIFGIPVGIVAGFVIGMLVTSNVK